MLRIIIITLLFAIIKVSLAYIISRIQCTYLYHVRNTVTLRWESHPGPCAQVRILPDLVIGLPW